MMVSDGTVQIEIVAAMSKFADAIKPTIEAVKKFICATKDLMDLNPYNARMRARPNRRGRMQRQGVPRYRRKRV